MLHVHTLYMHPPKVALKRKRLLKGGVVALSFCCAALPCLSMPGVGMTLVPILMYILTHAVPASWKGGWRYARGRFGGGRDRGLCVDVSSLHSL